jgi:hypothetical protein
MSLRMIVGGSAKEVDMVDLTVNFSDLTVVARHGPGRRAGVEITDRGTNELNAKLLICPLMT